MTEEGELEAEISISNFSKLADFHLFGGLTNDALRCLRQTVVCAHVCVFERERSRECGGGHALAQRGKKEKLPF